jgi:uncharacterized protein (DUF302 family)
MKDVSYGSRRELPGVDYEDAIARVEQALGEEGFGVLTRIDVKATLKEKLDADFKRYIILGACNPRLAHRALSADDDIGLLLPCNVVVAETETGSEVAYARPQAMLAMADLPELEPVAREAGERLARALERL